jgi:hypothetical protein
MAAYAFFSNLLMVVVMAFVVFQFDRDGAAIF